MNQSDQQKYIAKYEAKNNSPVSDSAPGLSSLVDGADASDWYSAVVEEDRRRQRVAGRGFVFPNGRPL